MKPGIKTAIVVLITLSLLITSCATLFTKGGSNYRKGKSEYNKKEYADAVDHLIIALEKNPEFEEALVLFPKAFNKGTEYYLSRTTGTPGPTDTKGADRIYIAFKNLVVMNELVKVSDFGGVVTVTDYSAEFTEARGIAVDTHYNLGTDLLAKGTIPDARAAVLEYEIVKKRNSDYPGLKDQLDNAIDAATVNVVVVGGSSNIPGYKDAVITMLQGKLYDSRFITVLSSDNVPGAEAGSRGRDAAINWSKAHDVDYLIDLFEETKFEKILGAKENIYLPEDTKLFPAVRSEWGYSKDFSCEFSIYRVSDKKKIYSDTLSYNNTESLFVEFIKAEGVKDDLKFDDTGKHNLRFITSTADSESIHNALFDIRYDYDKITASVSVGNETEIGQWKKYFLSNYDSIKSLAKDYNGIRQFYATEVVYTPKAEYDYFFIGGPTISDAIHTSARNSAIMNGLTSSVMVMIDRAKEDDSNSSSVFATQMAEVLKEKL